MPTTNPFNNLLVPVDFSDSSLNAFHWAVDLVDDNASLIIVLHVVDEAMVGLLTANGFGQQDELVHRLRERAEAQLREYCQTDREGLQIDRIVSVGTPFLEIIRKAEDFVVDAIVMGKVGIGGFEQLLFGSTAEKVLRGSKRPVLVLPGVADREDDSE